MNRKRRELIEHLEKTIRNGAWSPQIEISVRKIIEMIKLKEAEQYGASTVERS
ncbi:MAG TPA: hypothetical protein VJ824_08980 [Bacillota bacterium]|nr:hypothetical protein [Bacillota bacterium]